jgi:hypothetical protein
MQSIHGGQLFDLQRSRLAVTAKATGYLDLASGTAFLRGSAFVVFVSSCFVL